MSLDWILLMKGVSTNFYVESCEGYVEFNVDTYDEYVGSNCQCYDGWDNECGGCRLENSTIRVNSCSGYELCGNYSYSDKCCYEGEFIGMDEWGNPTDNYYGYYVYEYHFNEYILYWNDDLNVCYDNSCDEEFVSNNDEIFDIVIPSYFPNNSTNNCEEGGGWNSCEYETYFHPNCDTPIDTTITIGSKNVSIEKMGWLERDNTNNSNNNYYGYIHYYPLDNFLILENGSDIDLSNYKIVDYQRKE
jgi:hypothetical protein